MSWWSDKPLASQRHVVMQAANKYRAAVARVEVRCREHEAAASALKATGAELVYVRKPYDAEARIRLPTEVRLEDARAEVASAWREFYTILEECPAVQAEVFAMLGCQ